jgi:hypothetical protein
MNELFLFLSASILMLMGAFLGINFLIYDTLFFPTARISISLSKGITEPHTSILARILILSLMAICFAAIMYSFIFLRGSLLGFGLSFSGGILLYEAYVVLTI